MNQDSLDAVLFWSVMFLGAALVAAVLFFSIAGTDCLERRRGAGRDESRFEND